MVMALKQQVLMCSQPADLLLITLNHLDALRAYATTPTVSAQVESTLTLFIQVHAYLYQDSEGHLQCRKMIFYLYANFFLDKIISSSHICT